MQKLGTIKVSFDTCSKIVSSTNVHIDFGDVHRVMMMILGKVQI